MKIRTLVSVPVCYLFQQAVFLIFTYCSRLNTYSKIGNHATDVEIHLHHRATVEIVLREQIVMLGPPLRVSILEMIH